MTPIGNNLTPIGLPDGEHGFRAALNFVTDDVWRVDFNSFQHQGWQVRTIYVDNSLNDKSCVLTFSASGQKINVRAGYQAYIPVLQNQAEFVEVSSTGSEFVVPVFFLERFRQATTWASSAESASIIVTGLNFLPDNVDNVAPVGTNFFLATLTRNTVYDPIGNNWDRQYGNTFGTYVQGPSINGGPVSNPIQNGIFDGAVIRYTLGDVNGRTIVVGSAADGAAIAGNGNPLLIAGQDGANIQSILTDATGRLIVNINTIPTVTVIGNQTPADTVTTPTDALDVRSFLEVFNGATNDRARNSSASNLTATTQPFNLAVAKPGQWTITSTQLNAATNATKAAGGAGVRHVINNYSGSLVNSAAAATLSAFVIIRDGAVGVGAILWRENIGVSTALTGDNSRANGSGMSIVGSANAAMSIDAGTPGVNQIASVNLAGYSTV